MSDENTQERTIEFLVKQLQACKEENEKLLKDFNKYYQQSCIADLKVCDLTQQNKQMQKVLEDISNYMSKGCKGKQTETNYLDDCFTMGFCTNQCACYMMQHAQQAIKGAE